MFIEKGYLAKNGAYLKTLGPLGNPAISGMRWCAKQREVVDDKGLRVAMPKTSKKRSRSEFEAGDVDSESDEAAPATIEAMRERVRLEESMSYTHSPTHKQT